MTLIVGMHRHGRTLLAADTMAVSCDGWGQKFRGVNKIIPLKDGAIAFAGNGAVPFLVEQKLRDVKLNGIDVCTDNVLELLKAAVKKKVTDWEALMVSETQIVSIFEDRTMFSHDKLFDTKGSGSFIALGAIEAMYDVEMSNEELLEKTFAITAKNINSVGKFYNVVYTSQPT